MATDPNGTKHTAPSHGYRADAVTAAPRVFDSSTTGPRGCAELARRWLLARALSDRWIKQWGRLEAWSKAQYGWSGLSPEQREAMEAGKRLAAIDAQLDALAAKRAQLLEQLVRTPTRCVADLAAKLAVALNLLEVVEHPEAHCLISDVWRQLSAQSDL